MNKVLFPKSLAAVVAILTLSMLAFSQVQDAPPNGPPHGPQADVRGNALRELGLSQEQRLQIRRINEGRREALENANRRVREAMRALDAAVYADQLDEKAVQERLAELQAAQSSAHSLRFEKELAIRRVLTPEQLVRFRSIREEFEQRRMASDEIRRERRDMRPGHRMGDRMPPAQPMRPINKHGRRGL